MLALVVWQVNGNSSPITTNMIFIKYLPSAQFAFHAVTELTGFVQNMAPFALFRCFSKAFFLFYSKNLFKQKFWVAWACNISDDSNLVVEWVGWRFSVGHLPRSWSKRVADGNQRESVLYCVWGGNVSVCYLKYRFSVSDDIKNTYCTLKLAYCKCIPSSKACSTEQLVGLNLDFSSLPTTFFWVWWKHKLNHWK